MRNSSGLSERTGEPGATGQQEAAPESETTPGADSTGGRAAAESEPTANNPGFVQRGRIRRRIRYLRQLREVQLRDLGGFILELRRFGRERPDLVQAKVAAAESTDRELRTLERALSEEPRLRELREPGIGGACLRCGALHGSGDRFCASCGQALADEGHP